MRQHRCIPGVAARDLDCSDFQRLLVDTDVDLAPDASFGAAMLAGVPLAFPFNLDAGAVRCPAVVCLQTMSIRIGQGWALVQFLRSRRRELAMTNSLRMIAVIASFLHFPEATN